MIKYFSSTDFAIKDSPRLTSWIEGVVKKESRLLEELVFNFCSDESLLKINKEFLKHDTLTDVIAFDYSASKAVSGEVFISVDRVHENAKEFDQDFNDEIRRVMIHGVLHLCGYKDKTPKDKALMSDMENRYLAFFS